jgi:hypothetical protein
MSHVHLPLRRRYALLVLVASSLFVAATSCSDSSSRHKVMTPDAGNAAGAGGEGGIPEAIGGAAPVSEGGQPEGGAPVGAAGAQAQSGLAGQAEGGAGGEPGPSCVPAECAPGACVAGACVPVTTVASDVNLSTTSLTAGRTCAEAIAYSVLALGKASATLSAAPAAGCLDAGDELLLINLQGTTAAHDNVGNWELLRLSAVAGSNVTFTRGVTRFYGSAASSNAGLGVGATTERVALIRVPSFGRLVVNAGVTVTANAWDGALGGVVTFRAAQLDLSGTVSAAALGYRPGRWSMDGNSCANSTQTEAGESIGGQGTATTLNNLGASGGLSAGTVSYNSDNVVLSTPGHAQAGVVGFNPKGRTIGDPGAAYGSADATQLTLGSGPGGALNCIPAPTQATPYLFVGDTNQAGGIALLLVNDLKVEATGKVTATSPDSPRDIAFSGGYVYLSGSTMALGNNRVSAPGTFGSVPLGPLTGQKNQASPGYIVLSATSVTGTTTPAAHWLGH